MNVEEERLRIDKQMDDILLNHNIKPSSEIKAEMAEYMVNEMDNGNFHVSVEDAYDALYKGVIPSFEDLTAAAKTELAQTLHSKGYFTNADEYIDFLNTGKIIIKNFFNGKYSAEINYSKYGDLKPRHKTAAGAMLCLMEEEEPVLENEEVKDSEVLVKEFYMRAPDGSVFVTSDFGNLEPRHGYKAPVACNHSWKPYMGFTENYNYCEHCGVKEHEA